MNKTTRINYFAFDFVEYHFGSYFKALGNNLLFFTLDIHDIYYGLMDLN